MTTTTRTTTAVAEPRRAEAPENASSAVLEISTGADAAAQAAWARFVEARPDASIFQHPDWSAAVTAVFGHTPRHLLARRGGALVGVLPLMQVDSLLGGRLLVSVPYGTYGGVVGDDPAAVAALAAAARRMTDELGARVLDLRSAEPRCPDLEDVSGYLGFVRKLPERVEDVAAFLPKRARAAARHARDRDGVEVRHDPGLLRPVWELYCRSMRRIASINYPLALFEELAGRRGDRLWVSAALHGGRPVAGTISLVFRDTVLPYVLGADDSGRVDGAANLLYWSVMERAVAAGLRTFDYGRSRADNTGAVGFKKNQGFEPRPLGYQRYVPAGRRAPDLKPSNPRYALARRVWRRLPLGVTRVLGTWLARSLPG